MNSKVDEFDEEREKVLETLNDLDFLISPSTLRVEHTEFNDYHKFLNYILEPLLEEGEIIKIPNSTKGDLVASKDNIHNIVEKALNQTQE